MVGCGLLNVTVELIAYRPLRKAPRLAPLITAIGMSFILSNVGLVWHGSDYTLVPEVLPQGRVFSVVGVTYAWDKLIVLLLDLAVADDVEGSVFHRR